MMDGGRRYEETKSTDLTKASQERVRAISQSSVRIFVVEQDEASPAVGRAVQSF